MESYAYSPRWLFLLETFNIVLIHLSASPSLPRILSLSSKGKLSFQGKGSHPSLTFLLIKILLFIAPYLPQSSKHLKHYVISSPSRLLSNLTSFFSLAHLYFALVLMIPFPPVRHICFLSCQHFQIWIRVRVPRYVSNMSSLSFSLTYKLPQIYWTFTTFIFLP